MSKDIVHNIFKLNVQKELRVKANQVCLNIPTLDTGTVTRTVVKQSSDVIVNEESIHGQNRREIVNTQNNDGIVVFVRTFDTSWKK